MKFKVIYGPPCSGKTTYVKENIGENDIVYDYDYLSRALFYGTQHTVNKGNGHRYVIDFRSRITNLAKEENQLDNIWFICTRLTKKFKDSVKDLNPEYIKMDVSKEECLKRLENDDERPDKEEWTQKIEEWFENYGKKEDESVCEDEKRRKEVICRSFEVQTREEEVEQGSKELWVEGYAVRFNSPTVLFEYDGVEYKEMIDVRAFDDCNMSDVIFNYNHSGKVMARTRNKTLQLEVRKDGLFIRARLDGTEEGRRLYDEIKGGYIDRMSFQFTIREESYSQNDHMWTVYKLKRLYDVSAVDIPAYDDTSIEARKNSAVLEAKAQEQREREAAADLRKRKLKLKLLLNQ